MGGGGRTADSTWGYGDGTCSICSKPRYSVFAWAWSAVPWPGGVEQDFLEVPSMMLENWMYEPAVLQVGHDGALVPPVSPRGVARSQPRSALIAPWETSVKGGSQRQNTFMRVYHTVVCLSVVRINPMNVIWRCEPPLQPYFESNVELT